MTVVRRSKDIRLSLGMYHSPPSHLTRFRQRNRAVDSHLTSPWARHSSEGGQSPKNKNVSIIQVGPNFTFTLITQK